jgi:hypothetical protein
MDKNLDLNKSGALPECDVTEGVDNIGVSDAVLKRGFSVLDKQHPPGSLGSDQGPRSDSSGNTYEGDPNAKGGFLNRPTGWER